MPRSSGVNLVAHGGHSRWADPTLHPLHGGYALGADCDLGGVPFIHWLAPDPAHPGRYGFTGSPHTWPSFVDAFAALDAWSRWSRTSARLALPRRILVAWRSRLLTRAPTRLTPCPGYRGKRA